MAACKSCQTYTTMSDFYTHAYTHALSNRAEPICGDIHCLSLCGGLSTALLHPALCWSISPSFFSFHFLSAARWVGSARGVYTHTRGHSRSCRRLNRPCGAASRTGRPSVHRYDAIKSQLTRHLFKPSLIIQA